MRRIKFILGRAAAFLIGSISGMLILGTLEILFVGVCGVPVWGSVFCSNPWQIDFTDYNWFAPIIGFFAGGYWMLENFDWGLPKPPPLPIEER